MIAPSLCTNCGADRWSNDGRCHVCRRWPGQGRGGFIGWLIRRLTPATPSCFGTAISRQAVAENDYPHAFWLGGGTQPSLDFAFGGTNWPGLAKLAEESAEVNQVLAKLMQTGGDPQHWSGDMVEKLVEELPDLAAALQVFLDLNSVLTPHHDKMEERFTEKVEQFHRWHRDTLASRS